MRSSSEPIPGWWPDLRNQQIMYRWYIQCVQHVIWSVLSDCKGYGIPKNHYLYFAEWARNQPKSQRFYLWRRSWWNALDRRAEPRAKHTSRNENTVVSLTCLNWDKQYLGFRRYKAEWKRFSAAGVCSYSRMIYQIRFSALLLSRCLDIVINQTGSCAWRHLSRCRQNDNGMSDSDGKISI